MSAAKTIGHLTTEQLFREHARFVATFLTRLGVPREQLEDALQEVFLVVHRNGGYRPGLAKPTTYLANMAIFAAARHHRRERIARERYCDYAVDLLPTEPHDPGHALQVRRDIERLQGALERL